MRFLLVFLVVLVLAWRWRSWRDAKQLNVKRKNAATPDPTAMVACRHCGVHIPTHEAVVGAQGRYCSAAHRQHMEP